MNGVVSSKSPTCNAHTEMLHAEMKVLVILPEEVAVTVNRCNGIHDGGV